MPIAFDPDAKGAWSLESDRKKPKAARPEFLVKFLTDRQCDRLRELRAATEEASPQFWQQYWAAISFGVVGWRNMPCTAAGLAENAPFTLENLRALLTPDELVELFWNYHRGVEMDEGDVKNSLPPHSPASPEARAAAAATSEPAAA